MTVIGRGMANPSMRSTGPLAASWLTRLSATWPTIGSMAATRRLLNAVVTNRRYTVCSGGSDLRPPSLV